MLSGLLWNFSSCYFDVFDLYFFIQVSGILAHPLPEEIPMQFGVFCEPFSCLVRGWENMQPIRSDSNVLVCGAGNLKLEIRKLEGIQKASMIFRLDQVVCEMPLYFTHIVGYRLY